MTLSETVSKNLKATRITRKLSQEALAAKAGMSVSMISMLERHNRHATLSTLEQLAKALRVPPQSLLAA